MADQNGIVSIAALLTNHELSGCTEILKFQSEVERKDLMKTICDFCLAKSATFNKPRKRDLPLNTRNVVGKERLFLDVEGASLVRNNQDEIFLKISVLTFGQNLQFFTFHKDVKFSDRLQLSEFSYQRFGPIKKYASRAVENF